MGALWSKGQVRARRAWAEEVVRIMEVLEVLQQLLGSAAAASHALPWWGGKGAVFASTRLSNTLGSFFGQGVVIDHLPAL